MKGKYFLGNINEKNEYGNWFVGSFLEEGHPCKTDKVEFLHRVVEKGHVCKPHYHEEKLEILIMLKGKAKYKINDDELMVTEGNFIFIDVNNVIQVEFLEDSQIIVIHSPSLPKDKVVV